MERKFLLVLIVAVAVLIPFLMPKTIVVFTIDRSIMGHEDAFDVIKALDQIQNDISVRAVVLNINSPGGTSEAIEEIYYKVVDLRSKKPVVVSINAMGASGAYYISTPANYIFAKPSSEVGGIGVIVSLPEEVERPDLVVSGPFKLRRTKESVLETVDLLKRDFLRVVSENRKDRLKVDPIELTTAEIYIGIKGMEMGLIDELGGLGDAVSKAAELAGLVHYKVVYVRPLRPLFVSSLFVDPSQLEANSTTIPRFYHLYVNLGEGR